MDSLVKTVILISALICFTTAAMEDSTPGTVGKEFIFNFPTPHHDIFAPILMITTPYDTNVNVNISVPGIGFYKETTTNRQQHSEIMLPTSTYLLQDSHVQDKTVIVRANAGVSVYGMMSEGHQPDGFLAIPVHGLGTEYLVATSGPSCRTVDGDLYPTEFTLSAVQDQTVVQISTTTGQNISITMDAYEAYQIHDGYNDLTGSVITSNKPIAVMAGSERTGVPAGKGCGLLLEALPSVDLYWYSFTLGPFMGRSNGYVYRIVSPEKTTVEISQYGTIDIDNGEFFENIVNDETVTLIKSSNPVMVMQYTRGETDGKGAPSMVIVPPTEMFAGNVTFPVYDITVLSDYTFYINIIANCSYIPDMMYDDTIRVANWERLSQGDMCVSRGEVTSGTHSVGHPDTEARFSVTVYGFRLHFAFSYPAGFNIISNIKDSDRSHPEEEARLNYTDIKDSDRSHPEEEARLFSDLMTGYHKRIPPTHEGPVDVTMSFTLINFDFIDEANFLASVHGWISEWWSDPRLRWDPELYNGTSILVMEYTDLWVPDIELYNGVSVTETVDSKAILYSSGFIFRLPAYLITFKCNMDLYHFPYDKHNCELKFSSWHHDSNYINLNASSVDMTNEYTESADFIVKEMTFQRHEISYPCCPGETYIDVTYYLTVHRKTGAYSAKLVLPSVLTGFLVLATFLLPTRSHEKITLCSIIFLCLLLLLTYLHDIIPNSGDTILGEYLAFTLTIDFLATIIAVVAYKLDARSSPGKAGPPIVSFELDGDDNDLRVQRPKNRAMEWLRYLDIGCFLLFSFVFIIGIAVLLGRR